MSQGVELLVVEGVFEVRSTGSHANDEGFAELHGIHQQLSTVLQGPQEGLGGVLLNHGFCLARGRG